MPMLVIILPTGYLIHAGSIEPDVDNISEYRLTDENAIAGKSRGLVLHLIPLLCAILQRSCSGGVRCLQNATY
jgi:hypothetical protein